MHVETCAHLSYWILFHDISWFVWDSLEWLTTRESPKRISNESWAAWGGTLRVVSEKIEKKGLAAVVTGEVPSLETNHLCSRRVLFIGKLKKTGKLLQMRKSGDWNLNLAAAKKYKTGGTLQQTVLMELWLLLRSGFKTDADPHRDATQKQKWRADQHTIKAPNPWGLCAHPRKPKRPDALKSYNCTIQRNEKSAKCWNASQAY